MSSTEPGEKCKPSKKSKSEYSLQQLGNRIDNEAYAAHAIIADFLHRYDPHGGMALSELMQYSSQTAIRRLSDEAALLAVIGRKSSEVAEASTEYTKYRELTPSARCWRDLGVGLALAEDRLRRHGQNRLIRDVDTELVHIARAEVERLDRCAGRFDIWVKNEDFALMESVRRAFAMSEHDCMDFMKWLATKRTHPPKRWVRTTADLDAWVQTGSFGVFLAPWRSSAGNAVGLWYGTTRNKYIDDQRPPDRDVLSKQPESLDAPGCVGVDNPNRGRLLCERVTDSVFDATARDPEFAEKAVSKLEMAVQTDRDSHIYIRAILANERALPKTKVWELLGWNCARGKRVDRRLRRVIHDLFSCDTEWQEKLHRKLPTSPATVFKEHLDGGTVHQHVRNRDLEFSRNRCEPVAPEPAAALETLKEMILGQPDKPELRIAAECLEAAMRTGAESAALVSQAARWIDKALNPGANPTRHCHLSFTSGVVVTGPGENVTSRI